MQDAQGKKLLALQSDIVSKYNFHSSYVKTNLSPPFPSVWTSLNMFFLIIYMYAHSLSQKLLQNSQFENLTFS